MTLHEFIDAARQGTLLVIGGGEVRPGVFETHQVVLGIEDLDALTAEAYNQELFTATTPWAEARREVEAELAR